MLGSILPLVVAAAVVLVPPPLLGRDNAATLNVNAIPVTTSVGPVEFSACSFARAISPQPNVATSGRSCKAINNYLAPVSEVMRCISSLRLDRDNVTQYLDATINITMDYYVFTDVAVDPLKSVPLATPLGYSVYNGSQYGQVDLIGELQELKERVAGSEGGGGGGGGGGGDDEGPTLDVFYDVGEVFAKARDAHVEINKSVNTGGMLDGGSVFMFLYSGEEIVDSSTSVEFKVGTAATTGSENGDGDFVLEAVITPLPSPNDAVTKRVKQIDGKDPLAFFTDLALQPLGTLTAYKSLGPRVQSVIQSFLGSFRLRLISPSDSNPAKYYKDKYDVTYDDGTATTWEFFMTVPCLVTGNVPKRVIETILTQPGEFYDVTERAIAIIEDATASATASAATAEAAAVLASSARATASSPASAIKEYGRHYLSSVAGSPGERKLQGGGDGGGIAFTTFKGTNFKEVIGYHIADDYAVFKIDTFTIVQGVPLILQAWEQMSNEAAEKGVTKLIVDIIGNGGGEIDLGYLLAGLMYPDVNWEDFANPYDQVFSPSLDVYLNTVKPLFIQFTASTLSEGIIRNTAKELNEKPGALVAKMTYIIQALEGLTLLTLGRYYALTMALDAVQYLYEQVNSRTPASIRVAEVYILMQQLAPFRPGVLGSGEIGTSDYFSMADSNVPDAHVRGGIPGNYTKPFYHLDPGTFVTAREFIQDMENPKQFKQYLILADGNGVGSTANTFQSITSLYAKSSAGLVAPLSTVSYGGTGKKEDSAVTQFPGGSVKQVSLTRMYMPAILLLILHALAEGTDYGDNVLLPAYLEFADSLPLPCYYCDDLPMFTVFEIYSSLVGPESIPLEYVNQTPDYYIRQWPFETSFDHTNNLPKLYDRTSSFFDKQDINEVGSSPTSDTAIFLSTVEGENGNDLRDESGSSSGDERSSTVESSSSSLACFWYGSNGSSVHTNLCAVAPVSFLFVFAGYAIQNVIT